MYNILYSFKLYQILFFVLNIMSNSTWPGLQVCQHCKQYKKSIVWKYNADTQPKIFSNYNNKSKNSNTDSRNETAVQKLTLCWWLSLLFSDDVQNRLLSVKQNIFHTHHLTTNTENTIRHKQVSPTYFNRIGNKTISSDSTINIHAYQNRTDMTIGIHLLCIIQF